MEDQCHKERKVKIKIKKWLDTPEFTRYEDYIDRWHGFTRKIVAKAGEMPEEQLKSINMAVLQTFYFNDYDTERDFYDQFYERLDTMKDH